MKGKSKRHARADDFFKIVNKVIKQIYGETATATISSVVYTYLEQRQSIKREDIQNEPKLFKEALEECLGESTTSLIFKMILNEGTELKLKKVLWIYDPVEQRTRVALP